MMRWLAGLALVGLVGCGLSGGVGQDSPTLRIATGDSGMGLAPHRQVLQALQDQVPGFSLRLEPISGGDYYTRLFTELASGDPPDLLQVGDEAAGWLARRGCLLELTLPVDGLFPAVAEPGYVDRRLYLLPKDYSPLAVYCNVRLFRQAGLELPRRDWDLGELLDLAQRLSSKDQVGLVLPGVRSALLEWLVLLHGGQLFDPRLDRYQGALDGPATAESMRVLHRLYYGGGSPLPTELGSFTGGNQEFEQGRAAMKIGGHWSLAELRHNPEVELAILPLPGYAVPGQPPRRVNILHWAGMGVARGSHHRREALRVLQGYCGPLGSRAFSRWALPALREISREVTEHDPLEQVWISELDHICPRAYTQDRWWMQVGQGAVARLHEAVAVDPHLDVPAWTARVAAEADALRRRRDAEEP